MSDRATAWAVRCYHESTQHKENCFVTLTYKSAPPKLSLLDLQQFFKRLRKRGCEFRYFAVGEYGSKTRRPHYHALMFGQDFLGGAEHFGTYWTNQVLQETWGQGFVAVAPCEAGSIFYTTGYALKNLSAPDCFHVASRVPYIGKGWLAKYSDDIARNGFVTIDGVKRPVPRSYLARAEHLVEFSALKERREVFVSKLSPELVVARRAACRSREIHLLQKAAVRKGDL